MTKRSHTFNQRTIYPLHIFDGNTLDQQDLSCAVLVHSLDNRALCMLCTNTHRLSCSSHNLSIRCKFIQFGCILEEEQSVLCRFLQEVVTQNMKSYALSVDKFGLIACDTHNERSQQWTTVANAESIDVLDQLCSTIKLSLQLFRHVSSLIQKTHQN